VKGGRGWRLLAGFCVALALLTLVLRGVDRATLAHAFSHARRDLLLLSLATTLVLYVVRSWRWGFLLAPLGRVRFSRLFQATVLGFMSGLVIPRAGEVLRPYLVGRAENLRLTAVFASIVLERLLDLVSVLGLFALYVWVLPVPAAQTRGPLLETVKVAGGLTGLAVLALLGLLLALHVNAERALGMLGWVLGWLPTRLADWLDARLREFVAGLAVLQAPLGHLAAILAQSVLLWVVIAAGVYFNNRAFGIELPFHSTFLMLLFLVVGVAVPTPGMVGGFHAAYVVVMTQAFGVDRATATAAGIMNHALTQGPVLLMGLAILMTGGGQGLTLSKVADMAEHHDGEAEPPPEAPPEPRTPSGEDHESNPERSDDARRVTAAGRTR